MSGNPLTLVANSLGSAMQGTTYLEKQERLYEVLISDQSRQHFQPEFWRQQERLHGDEIYAEILFLLTRMQFANDEARQHWYNILGHRLSLQAKLGRDIGMQVALADYFVNINPKVERPIIVEVNLFLQKEQSALRDELTGLFNRRFFNSILEKQQAMSDRFGQDFSLLMADVDDFKVYNDRLGHLAGDRTLTQVAQVLTQTSRSVDYLVRYGGEEFAVILPGINKEQALIAAERHRQAVEQYNFYRQECQPGGNLTISFGAATYPHDAQNAYDLVQAADVALYAAKFAGRNRVEAARPDRRHHPRIPYVAAVDLLSQNGQLNLQGESRDISLSGIRLALDHPLDEGEPLAILVHCPELEQALKLAGLTVRLEVEDSNNYKYQIGVQFRDQGMQHANSWRKLITRLSSQAN
jgi:diguanylate cyclase (GGDEF)-like protein